MKSKFNYSWLLLLVPAAFISWYFLSSGQSRPLRVLPYYSPKNSAASTPSAHIVPPFTFTGQSGQKVTEATVKDHIYVSEFFFTTCQSICPVMNSQLKRVYEEFQEEPRVMFLSHTVDPGTDSVEALMRYALQLGVNDKRWLFLTGDKKDLYSIARKGYMLDNNSGNGDDEDFIHTQNFALVDAERKVRGFYDGTDSLEVNRLIGDIKLLIKDYEYRKNIAH
jgi:protein SCO1/2